MIVFRMILPAPSSAVVTFKTIGAWACAAALRPFSEPGANSKPATASRIAIVLLSNFRMVSSQATFGQWKPLIFADAADQRALSAPLAASAYRRGFCCYIFTCFFSEEGS